MAQWINCNQNDSFGKSDAITFSLARPAEPLFPFFFVKVEKGSSGQPLLDVGFIIHRNLCGC